MLIAVVLILTVLAVGFLIEAGLVALFCWALPMIGITTIGSWTVAFSWPLVIAVWVVSSILGGIFKSNVEVRK